MTWILQNIKLITGCLVLLVVTNLLMGIGAYLKGDANGYSRATGEINKAKTETINENIKIIDKALAYDDRTDDAYLGWLRSQQD